MQWYFSASVNGFFNDAIHKQIPDDAVKIAAEVHGKMMDGQAEGMVIVAGRGGRPTLKERTIDPILMLANAKTKQKALIVSLRDAALAAGVEYEGDTFQADVASHNLLSGVIASIAAGVPLPDGFVWRTIDNENVIMTVESVKGLGHAMFAYIESCHHTAWSLKAAVDQATTIDAVQSITW